ncbi:MAG: N-acetyltransferase [Verrucomicrobiota bacterium JB023]|nr:N-acetyltransferase [Verrucomicrobiota bacterium JB023]
MTKSHFIRPAVMTDEAAAIDTLILAFATDPMVRWTWPDPSDYLAIMPRFIKAFGGQAFSCGSAYLTKKSRGVALWLPPENHPNKEGMISLVESSIPESRHHELFKVFEMMEEFHPQEPHWHLPLLGVDPMYQGHGLGSALLDHALQRCDNEGCQAYLESSNPRNIALYQRYGFQPLGEIQSGTSPTAIPMLRLPN